MKMRSHFQNVLCLSKGKEIRKKILPLLLVWAVLCGIGMQAQAQDEPDLTRQGSITITMKQGGNVVSGGFMTLYQAASLRTDGSGYQYELVGAFAAYGKTLEVTSASAAAELVKYAQKSAGVKKEIDQSGILKYENLPSGLYLLVQDEAAEGYEKIEPFLVSVPMTENNTYIYDVDATPKLELVPEETESEYETEAETKPSPLGGGGGSLPQTGQLNWPVPLLAISGLILFIGGWLLRSGQRKEEYEK